MKSHRSRHISSAQSPRTTRSTNKTLTIPNPNPPPPPSTPSRPPPSNPSAAMSSPSTPSDSASRGANRRRSSRLAAKSGAEEQQGKDLIDSDNLGSESGEKSEVRVKKGRGLVKEKGVSGSGSGSDSVRRSGRIASKMKNDGDESELKTGEKRKNEDLGGPELIKVRVLDFGDEEASDDVEKEKEKEKDSNSHSGMNLDLDLNLNDVGDKVNLGGFSGDVKEEEVIVVPDSPTKSGQSDGNVGLGALRRRSQRLALNLGVKESNVGSSSIGNQSVSNMPKEGDKESDGRPERMEVPGGHNLANGGTKRRSPRLAHEARVMRPRIGNAGGVVGGNAGGLHNPELPEACVINGNGIRIGGLNLDLNATPDSQEKKVKLDLNLKPEEQGEHVQGMDIEDSSLVLSAANALMQLPQTIESERVKQTVRWKARSRSLRMERFQDIARERASHFAHFRAEEEEGEATDPASNNENQSEEIEDWPGPFSTAMKIIRDRYKQSNAPRNEDAVQDASTTAPIIDWVPSKKSAENCAKHLVPSLQDLCLKILSKNAEAIASLKFVPTELRNKLTHLLCDVRKMNSQFMDLLVADSPEIVRVNNCAWLTEEQFTKTFDGCDTTKLSELQLDQSGRCITDYVIRDTLARSPNCLPALVSISLKGSCRLTDIGLASLVASSPSLRSINLSQCSLITSVGIDTIASRLGFLVKELYLDECQGIDAMLMLPSLKKLRCLEVLSVADSLTVSDDFVCQLVSDQGQNMKELGLAECHKLTDRSVKAISENCSGLCALDLRKLRKLTDISIAHLANGCLSIRNLKLRSNQLSDEAIAAFLETSGHSLQELSLNGVKKVGPNTAISLAKICTRNLQCLDLSWCRNLTDDALGYIADNCLSLRVLKLFGCTQITNAFVNGHSNHQLRVIGLAMTPILEHLDVLVPQDGPLRYSYIPSLPV